SCPLAVATRAAIGIREIGVVEEVKGLNAELRLQPFSEFEALGDGKVDVMETCVAEDVATHSAKGSERRRKKRRFAISIATGEGQHILGGLRRRISQARGRACWCSARHAKNIAKSGRGGIGINRKARWRDIGEAIRPLRPKVRRIAEEIPAIGQIAGSAQIKGLVIDSPRLPALQRDDGIELPAFKELAPGFLLRERVGHGERKAVSNVKVAAVMV